MSANYKKLRIICLPCFVFCLLLITSLGCDDNGDFVIAPAPLPSINKLNIEILDASINSDRRAVITFRIFDDEGNPIDSGIVRIRLIIARIESGDTQYQDYITRVQTSSITGVSATQASSENADDGTLVNMGGGLNQYTFNTVLPPGFDPNATHTVGIFADVEILGRQFVANATFDFVPSGGGVRVVRDVVRVESCNTCHDPLKVHGGFRRDVKLCVLCHTAEITDSETGVTTPQIDPDTGNSIDLKVMVHKIHRGAELPSVQEGTPYQIVGFRDSVHDFSEVEFPQNIKNCEKCHGGIATQADNFKTNPSRAACGSCHDDVVFATAENHPVVQLDDDNCPACHLPSTGTEFDISVDGAHTVLLRAASLPGVNFEIVSVRSAETSLPTVGPGEHVQVAYSIKTDAGAVITPQDMDSISLVIAGPTNDYDIQDYNGDGLKTPGAENVLRERPADASVGPDASGNFTYTFDGMIPADATGTYAIGIEGRIARTVGGDDRILIEEVEEAGQNVVFYFPVTDPVAVPRRMVVDNTFEGELCSACHGVFSKDFSIHGNLRNNTEYCVLCHNPSADDIAVRPVDFPGDPAMSEAIHFKVMIHKIHTGEELTEQPYIIFGFRGSVNDFGEVLFPGDRRNCEECHLQDTYVLDLGFGVLGPGVLSTTEREFTKDDSARTVLDTFFTTPIIATCTGCHDGLGVTVAGDALTGDGHPGGAQPEGACVACHSVGNPLGVENVHFPPLPPELRIGRPN